MPKPLAATPVAGTVAGALEAVEVASAAPLCATAEGEADGTDCDLDAESAAEEEDDGSIVGEAVGSAVATFVTAGVGVRLAGALDAVEIASAAPLCATAEGEADGDTDCDPDAESAAEEEDDGSIVGEAVGSAVATFVTAGVGVRLALLAGDVGVLAVAAAAAEAPPCDPAVILVGGSGWPPGDVGEIVGLDLLGRAGVAVESCLVPVDGALGVAVTVAPVVEAGIPVCGPRPTVDACGGHAGKPPLAQPETTAGIGLGVGALRDWPAVGDVTLLRSDPSAAASPATSTDAKTATSRHARTRISTGNIKGVDSPTRNPQPVPSRG